jgi:hypothetical protein
MEVNKLIKANEDFELSMKEIEKWHRSSVKQQMIVENHIDVQIKVWMEQEDHQNFGQHYQSNLNEI